MIEFTVARFPKFANVSAGKHALIVCDRGEPFWPDWWLLDSQGGELRRVRDLEHGITTAKVTIACWIDAPPRIYGSDDPFTRARVQWYPERPADLLNGGSSVKR